MFTFVMLIMRPKLMEEPSEDPWRATKGCKPLLSISSGHEDSSKMWLWLAVTDREVTDKLQIAWFAFMAIYLFIYKACNRHVINVLLQS